jgi:hypothetical protein
MLGEPLSRQACGEVPATTPRLAPLVVAQRVGQDFGDLLGRRDGKIGEVRGQRRVVGHEPKLGGAGERNKNEIRLTWTCSLCLTAFRVAIAPPYSTAYASGSAL